MICPICQSRITDGTRNCTVCRSPLPQAGANLAASDLPALWQTRPGSDLVSSRPYRCPTCQSEIKVSSGVRECPVCHSTLVDLVPDDTRSRQAPTSGNALLGPSRREENATSLSQINYSEGIVVGDPIILPDEPRDVDPIHALVAVLFLVEALVVAWFVSMQLLAIVLILVVAALLVRRNPLSLAGCLINLFALPFRLAGLAWRPVRDAFNPDRNWRNVRQVREYRLQLAAGTCDAFVVKGNLAPRTLRRGDTVRVWTATRGQRVYFQRGLYRSDAGDWVPLQMSEQPTGVYWLVGFVIVTAVLAYLYLTYIRGH